MKATLLKITKIALVFLLLILTQSANAQAPQKMSYQAVIRNNSNTLIASTAVGIKISILQSSASGTAVYSETHTTNTNSNGLVSLEIGTGSIVTGTFSGINWANGPYFIKTETDPTGGTNYTIAGTSELLSVPYALFSANSTPGAKGDKGDKGDTGATGAAGVKGDKGDAGVAGAKGDKGDKGDIGVTGATGSAGATGAKGDKGDTGATGAAGVAGAKGDKGDKGDIGATGATGSAGATGAKGDKGDTGTTGAAGVAGAKGDKGDKGDIGATGAKGDKGDTGATGPAGTASTTFKTVMKGFVYNPTTTGTYVGPSSSGAVTASSNERCVVSAPYNGKVIKILASTTSAVAGSTSIQIYKNGLSVETQTVNMAAIGTSYSFNFTTNTFATGDRITFYLTPANNVTNSDVSLTYVFEFTP